MQNPHYLNFLTHMRSEVFGIPEDLIDSIGRKIALYKHGFQTGDAPLGAFLLTGDPGTGKSLTAAAIAKFLHHNERSFLKIAGEEYSHSHNVARLVGAPPGYLGHRETTPILSAAKLGNITSEHSNLMVILVDEVDKAHPELAKIFLGALNDGYITLGDNSKVSFTRAIFLFTANFSASGNHDPGFGFLPKSSGKAQISQREIKLLGGAFLDRIESLGGIFQYPVMTPEVREKIYEKSLDIESERLSRILSGTGGAKVCFYMCDELKQHCVNHDSSGRVTAARVRKVLDCMLLQNMDAINELPEGRGNLNRIYILNNYDIRVETISVTKAAKAAEV